MSDFNVPDSENQNPTENTELQTDPNPINQGIVELSIKTGDVTKNGWRTKLFGNKKLVGLVAVLAVLLLGAGVYALTRSDTETKTADESSSSSQARIGAKISYIEGSVELKSGESYDKLAVDNVLSEGATVRTNGTTSRATIALDNGSFVRLNGDTEVTLTSLVGDEIVIMQSNGQVYSRVSPSTAGSFAVETNTSTYTAQGTAFMTTNGGDEESVEVYESQVKENTLDKSVNQGEKLFIKNVPDPTKEGTVQPLDIETVKTNEFVQWCREEDEKSEEYKDDLGFLTDVTSPELSISSPADGSTVTVESTATSGSVAFKGKTEAGATVTIQSISTGAAPVNVTVGADGSFQSDAIAGIIGKSVYDVIAKDKAGNKNKITLSVTFKKKTTAAATGIVLSSGGTSDGKYNVAWTVPTSFVDGEGFKVVWNTSGDPTYPTSGTKSGAQFVEADERTASISLDKSSESELKYYVRVCRYTGGECDSYSNTITITVPKKNS